MTIGLYHPRALTGDGGITRSVRSLSTALNEQGHNCRVICDGPTHPDGRPSWRGISHLEVGPISIPVGIDDSIRDLDVLVLHSAWVSYNLVAGRRARLLHVPYVLAPRGAYEPRILERKPAMKRLWWNVAESRLVERAAAIHVFFDSQLEQVRRLGYEGPVVVAPNGVSVPDDIRWDGGSLDALLYVGRFDMEHKGLDTLLAGLRLMRPEGRPRLILCGPDWRGGKEQTKARINELGLHNWVEVRPPIFGREKFELMASARGFVYPSLFEAFGNSAAEAAALGVPVLTGQYPLGDYLMSRHAGLAVPPEPGQMAAGLEKLVDSSAAALGANARSAMGSFSWEAVATDWASQLLSLDAIEG